MTHPTAQPVLQDQSDPQPAPGQPIIKAWHVVPVWTVLTGPAVAIPSPELVVGSLSSLGQLAALVAATLGSSALLASATRAAAARQARRAWQALGIMSLVAIALLATVVCLVVTASEQKQARLEANLLRPARQPGQAQVDPTLKELSYRGQEAHPLGVTTAETASLLGADAQDTVLVDVREDAEIEMGTLPGVKAVRFPDFNADATEFAGKTLVFFCHNGNRSHETCEALAARGIACRFIVGGLEKWVVEKRPTTGLQNRSLADLRAIPGYPNRDRLLDTPDVVAAVTSGQAQFVDVRYPGEFAVQHLPGAVNLPIRRMSRAQLTIQLQALPKRPVILPCYDRRSCFFAEVAGLELHRAGHQVLGRYTQPQAYFEPAPRPPHVEAWLAQRNTSAWAHARTGLASGLAHVADTWTGLPLAIALLALLSRLLVLPFALKSEQDQIAARQAAPALADLKRRLADDPVRLRRALQAVYASHGLTPVRNLVALAFLPVLALAVSAVGDAAAHTQQAWLWLPSMAAPDPTVALPLVFALILAGYCAAVLARTQQQRWVTMAVALPGITWLTVGLPAASALYLVASALLLVVQRAWVTRVPARLVAAVRQQVSVWQERRLGGALAFTRAVTMPEVGNKARRLADLSAAGFPVPAGLVLDQAALSAFLLASPKLQRRLAKRYGRFIGSKQLAVRSSAAGEDGTANSFAGVFATELNVATVALPAAIARVAQSFTADRAKAYGHDAAGGNVLIQAMADARYAGVLFTRAPDAPGQMLIELVDGLGEALVSGRQTPRAYRVGRLSHQVTEGPAAPIDLGPLAHLGRKIADHFGAAQDIEWAYSAGQFSILQSRDITADLADRHVVRETDWLVARAGAAPAGTVVLAQDAMTELLPRPTPLSLDLLNALWAPGGSVDLACRRLGLTYAAREDDPQLYVTVFGRLLCDVRLSRRRAPQLSPRQRQKLLQQAAAIAGELRTAIVPKLRTEVALLAAIDPARLPRVELHALWQRQVHAYVTEVHPHAEVINILAAVAAADASLQDARGDTRPDWHTQCLALDQTGGPDRTGALQHCAGHRTAMDYELAQPRWSEVPGALDAFVAGLPRRAPSLPGLGSAADLQALKEDAKHEVLRFFAVLRRLALELDRRHGLGGHIFQLRLDEIAGLSSDTAGAMQILARTRRLTAQRWQEQSPPPAQLGAREIEAVGMAQATPDRAVAGNCKGRGTRVSGKLEVNGRAFVASATDAETGAPLTGFRDGDILVAPMVHPDWLDVLLRAGGVVTEIGGWLSHMAIVAREHDVAMIVAVPNAGHIRTGDPLRLMPDGRVLAERDVIARLALVVSA